MDDPYADLPFHFVISLSAWRGWSDIKSVKRLRKIADLIEAHANHAASEKSIQMAEQLLKEVQETAKPKRPEPEKGGTEDDNGQTNDTE